MFSLAKKMVQVTPLLCLLSTYYQPAFTKMSKCGQNYLQSEDESELSRAEEWSKEWRSGAMQMMDKIGQQLAGPASSSSYPHNIKVIQS